MQSVRNGVDFSPEHGLCGVVDGLQETKKNTVDGAYPQCPGQQAHFNQGLSLPVENVLWLATEA